MPRGLDRWTAHQNEQERGQEGENGGHRRAYDACKSDPQCSDVFQGYLVFSFFITDRFGRASHDFVADESLHVLWRDCPPELLLTGCGGGGGGTIYHDVIAKSTAADPKERYDLVIPARLWTKSSSSKAPISRSVRFSSRASDSGAVTGVLRRGIRTDTNYDTSVGSPRSRPPRRARAHPRASPLPTSTASTSSRRHEVATRPA